MSTTFLHQTEDPNEDITNAPQYYHNFNGKAVRIRVYWTAPIWQDFKLWSQSLFLITHADRLLRKYTLSLDVMPTGAPAAVHAAMRAKLAGQFGPSVTRAVARLPQSVRSFAGEILDQSVDDVAATTQGLIDFKGWIDIPHQQNADLSQLQELRKLIDPVAELNRLVVVFVPINGPASGQRLGPGGYTALFAQWLPWVVVDPRSFDSTTTLIHEIGHACRLGHRQEDWDYTNYSKYPKNVMYSSSTNQTHFWCWQVDTIFDSYWCNGEKPPNPLNYTGTRSGGGLPHGGPFLWDE